MGRTGDCSRPPEPQKGTIHRWHASLVSTSRATSASRSHSPTSTDRPYPRPAGSWPRPGSTRTPASRTWATRSSSSSATRSRPTSRSRVTSAARSQADIRRKVEIGSYQGVRHRSGLPVRGQRTKTNARTRKGPKRTVAGKKKAGSDAAPRAASPPPLPTRTRQEREHMPPKSRHRRRQEGAPQGEEEHRSGRSPHQEHVQQHDHHDHRPHRCRDLVGLGRQRRLQGLAQVHPVRRADGRRGRWPPGDGARHEEGRRLRQGPGLGPRDRDPFAGRRPASRSARSRTSRPRPHNGVRPPKRRRV